MNDNEQWRRIYIWGNETNYSVSNLGRVRNDKTGHIKSQCSYSTGYVRCTLIIKGYKRKQRAFTVHRLVAEAFLSKPECDKTLVVDHLDGNKRNNRADNLEWVTNLENMRRAAKKRVTVKQKYKLFNSETEEVIEVCNLHSFCQSRGLAYHTLYSLCKGGITETKTKWRLYENKDKVVYSGSKPIEATLINPEGKLEKVHNLKQWCDSKNRPYVSMHYLVVGKTKRTRDGWMLANTESTL